MSYEYKLGMFTLHNVSLMQISGSSAIAAVNFGENNAVNVKFQGNDTEYGFVAQNATLVKTGLETTISKGESVGRLIAKYRSEGQLKAV